MRIIKFTNTEVRTRYGTSIVGEKQSSYPNGLHGNGTSILWLRPRRPPRPPLGSCLLCLAKAAVLVVFEADIDGVLEVTTEFIRFFLRQSVPGNNFKC